jgi:hypothetical protein
MMSGPGVIFKRCGCRSQDGRRLEKSCPRLGERGHVTCTSTAPPPICSAVPSALVAAGFPHEQPPDGPGDGWLDASAADRTADGWTVERWLRQWLDSRMQNRSTTRLHYTRDVELVLIPRLGRYRLADLDGPPLRTAFARSAPPRTTPRPPARPPAKV